MKDEFDELMEELNLENFGEDFEAKPAMYQVWVLGYDKDQNITDWNCLVDESRNPDRMIERAKTFIAEKQFEGLAVPEEIEYIEVLVETTVDFDDYESNEGTLFTATVKVK